MMIMKLLRSIKELIVNFFKKHKYCLAVYIACSSYGYYIILSKPVYGSSDPFFWVERTFAGIFIWPFLYGLYGVYAEIFSFIQHMLFLVLK